MSIRELNISNRVVFKLNNNYIYTLGQLLYNLPDYYQLFFNAADVDMIVNAAMEIDPLFGYVPTVEADAT